MHYQPTDRPTDRRTDRPSYRGARTHLNGRRDRQTDRQTDRQLQREKKHNKMNEKLLIKVITNGALDDNGLKNLKLLPPCYTNMLHQHSNIPTFFLLYTFIVPKNLKLLPPCYTNMLHQHSNIFSTLYFHCSYWSIFKILKGGASEIKVFFFFGFFYSPDIFILKLSIILQHFPFCQS